MAFEVWPAQQHHIGESAASPLLSYTVLAIFRWTDVLDVLDRWTDVLE